MIAEVDADGSGNIDFIEFLNMMGRKLAGLKPQEQIKDAFDLIDFTGTGNIPLQSLYSVRRGNQQALVVLLCSQRGIFCIPVDSAQSW